MWNIETILFISIGYPLLMQIRNEAFFMPHLSAAALFFFMSIDQQIQKP